MKVAVKVAAEEGIRGGMASVAAKIQKQRVAMARRGFNSDHTKKSARSRAAS